MNCYFIANLLQNIINLRYPVPVFILQKLRQTFCCCLQEDIHTSRIPSQIPPCNHLIHKTCFDEMLAPGHYACPLCGISMIPMSEIWKMYDKEIAESPMPEEYANLYAGIQCRDCLKASLVPFHLMGRFTLSSRSCLIVFNATTFF